MTASSISLDIYEVCASIIESFRNRTIQVEELIWNHQAQVEGFDIDRGNECVSLLIYGCNLQ